MSHFVIVARAFGEQPLYCIEPDRSGGRWSQDSRQAWRTVLVRQAYGKAAKLKMPGYRITVEGTEGLPTS